MLHLLLVSPAFWIILTGSLVAACCGLLGCFLILRKTAMVGDAISHSVLPGIFIAYWLTGDRANIPMLIGAAGLGILTTFLIELLSKKGNLQTDASIGLTFTFLFAVGIILISAFSDQVDLDQDCVLYGEIAFVPLEQWYLPSGLAMGPVQVWIMGIVLICVIALISIGYKYLQLTTFDAAFAAAMGISISFWHYLLMGAVSLVTVVSFESVGAILVVAFLIGPAAIAYLLTDNLKIMLVLSVVVGCIISFLGYYLAVWLDSSIAGAMTTVTGILFTIVMLSKLILQKRYVQAQIEADSIKNPIVEIP